MQNNESTIAGHVCELPEFLEKPAPITNIEEIKEYDVVIIGAGSPGVPCALSAVESGAEVALLQKEAEASACGNFGSGIELSTSNPADVEALVSTLMAASSHRPKRGLLSSWAQNSGEAINWLIKKAEEAGAQVSNFGNGAHAELLEKYGYKIDFITSFFGPKPYDVGEALKALCGLAEKEGVNIFYNTPAQQLVLEDGRVIGVIAKSEGKYVQFNARKGVVMATGDYQNDGRMLSYYLPDVANLVPKKAGRTGDGHKMIVWAGGKIENLGHTKMCHDFDSGPATMCDMPFMRVKLNGKRFCDETLGMELMNCYLLGKEDSGQYCQIFDSAYMSKAADWSGGLVSPEEMKTWMPEEDVERNGVEEDLINTHKADTLEELAEKMGITDVPAFLETVKKYNEMTAAGADTEFGMPSEFMKSIDTPPYYGIHRHLGMSMACSGVEVNENLQCLDTQNNPIEGLYAIGNCAGNFFGGVEYPMAVAGLNLGHNYTQGYVVGKRLAKL
ncbi:FAD-dependent oxidoreductase [Maridesulfovibrio bastinii]|uniref:FAD-dependent oxidoreductase n=1 Tax=Maridesulfovibrio bastinii TaxID=47157 RepID=UPI00041E31F0|nr:FAD-dependent oxidoreductase [Maridesulfovibrio bastinii]